MTSLALSLWIALGIALQLAIYLGIGFWGHWTGYQALRRRADELALPAMPVPRAAAGEAVIATWTGFRTFRVERRTIEDAAQSVCSFYLAADDGKPLPAFLPGQFLTFRLDLPAAAGGSETLVRCYSLSDAPRADSYRISVKRVAPPPGSAFPPGRSSNHFHDGVAVGSRVQVRAPAGHFYLDAGDAPVVLIGGGIGITPLLSMLNWSLAQQPGREIWLFHGVRHGHEMVMKEHLAALAAAHPNFHLRLCLSDPLPDDVAGRDYAHRGRVDVKLLRLQLPLKPYHFYICGPAPMMSDLVSGLAEWGVPEARVHFEAFGPASIQRPAAAASALLREEQAQPASGVVVTFTQSGRQLPWTPASGSLLEFAEANGIAVDSGCRAGGCGSCQTTVKSGQVIYRQPPDFDPEPGSCLLCVCTPKTSLSLEA